MATLICFSFWYDEISELKAPLVLAFTALGGYFGGAVRALIMLISETGLHTKEQKNDDADLYLSRWPLYIFKPFIGVGTGILFFLAVNFGLVQPLSSQPMLSPLPVFLLPRWVVYFSKKPWPYSKTLSVRFQQKKVLTKNDDCTDSSLLGFPLRRVSAASSQ